ncbi:MAG: hypothetical protein ACR2LJ_11655 [Acidimicrobiales bacterium]
MDEYVQEIRHAVEQLVPIIWEEGQRLRQLEAEVGASTRQTHHGYQRAEALAIDADDVDDVAMATQMQWETYFGPDRERYCRSAELQALARRATAQSFSVAALASALLQYGKQGISIVHGSLGAAPDGRTFGWQLLKEVIWQGRNQGLHWEDQDFRPPVERCFEVLPAEVDRKFGDYRSRNMAIDVLGLLEWHDFEAFARDLRSLG